MALAADMAAQNIADQQEFKIRAMGIVATGAGECAFRPAWIFCPRDRVAAYRVASGDAFEGGVTTRTEVVGGLVELKRIVCGMGVVAGDTADAV